MAYPAQGQSDKAPIEVRAVKTKSQRNPISLFVNVHRILMQFPSDTCTALGTNMIECRTSCKYRTGLIRLIDERCAVFLLVPRAVTKWQWVNGETCEP